MGASGAARRNAICSCKIRLPSNNRLITWKNSFRSGGGPSNIHSRARPALQKEGEAGWRERERERKGDTRHSSFWKSTYGNRVVATGASRRRVPKDILLGARGGGRRWRKSRGSAGIIPRARGASI